MRGSELCRGHARINGWLHARGGGWLIRSNDAGDQRPARVKSSFGSPSRIKVAGKSYGRVVTIATMDTIIINGHAQLCDLLSNQTGTEYGRLSSVVARPQQTDKWYRRRQHRGQSAGICSALIDPRHWKVSCSLKDKAESGGSSR